MRSLFFCLLLVFLPSAAVQAQQLVSFVKNTNANFLAETAVVEAFVSERMPQITSEMREGLRKQTEDQFLAMFKMWSLSDPQVREPALNLIESKNLLLKSNLVSDFQIKLVDSEELSPAGNQALQSGTFTLSKAQVLNAMANAAMHNNVVYFKTNFAKRISFEDTVAIMAHELSHRQDEQIKKMIALQLKKDQVITEQQYQDYKIRIEVLCDLEAIKILHSLKLQGVSPEWLVNANQSQMFPGVEKDIRVSMASYHAQQIANETVASK